MFRISSETIDLRACRQRLMTPSAGALGVFEGWVRNHNEGRAVRSLEYEAYVSLAEKEGRRILEEALDRFGVEQAYAEHRIGHLEIGETAVWVGVAARHREEAFAACRYGIDEIKRRVPIWKREHYVDGDAAWVDCRRCGHHHGEDG